AVGHDLRQRGARALSLAGRAGSHSHLATRQHADGHALEGSKARAFDIGGNTDADIFAVPARLPLAFVETPVVGKAQGSIVSCRIVAAVVDERLAVTEGQADRVRHLLGPNVVAAAQVSRIDRQLTGN